MATRLIFRTQPDGAVVSTAFTQQPVVWAVDDAGALDTTYTGTVTIAKKYGVGTLSGTAAVAASGGIVTYAGLSLGTAGHTALEVTASGLTAARSGTMTVMPAATAARTTLDWNSSTGVKVDLGSAAGLDDMTASDMTWMGRIKRTGTGNNQFICAKGNWAVGLDTTNGEGSMFGQQNTSGTLAISYANSSNLLASGTWYDVAAVWTVSTKTWTLFIAATGTDIAEVSGYSPKTAGTGTLTSDAANSVFLGNLDAAPTNPFKGAHEWHTLFTKALTVAQMKTVQQGFDRKNAAMITAIGSCKFLHQLNATGTLTDLSGNGFSGTVTSFATATGETVFVPTVFRESYDVTDRTDYLQSSSDGAVQFTTSATLAQVAANRLTGSGNPNVENALTVWNAGAYDSESQVTTATAKQYKQVTLPAGTNKPIVIRNPANTIAGSVGVAQDTTATGMVSLRFNASATEVIPPTPTRHIVIFGDSVMAGVGLSTTIGQSGPTQGFRLGLDATTQMTSICYGGNSLKSYAADATARTATVTLLKPMSPTDVILILGVNDYNQASIWNASSYGTAGGALVDAIIAEFPTCNIRVVTSITIGTGEGANGYGDTNAQYRSALASACAGKANTTVHDGPTELWDGSNPNADNIHPSNTSAPGIIANLRVIAGLDLPTPFRQHQRQARASRVLLTL